ncbi:MAG: hypothetical protein RL490_1790 [Pseudomonadota bacterium]
MSRAALPKQMLVLTGSETMLRQTAARVGDAALFHPPMVVTGTGQAEQVREALGADTPLLIEPLARNTAPAIALATLAALARDPDAVLLVMPSDHQLQDPGVLIAAVATASTAARDGWLVTFGIRAAAPETGYGYIHRGDAIAAAPGVFTARAFIEKPDRARAQALIADGGHSWNSGIFLFSGKAMRAALATHAPAVLAAAEGAMAAAQHDGQALHADAAAFAASPSISIDHAVFEHAERVAVCPIDPGWSDIGSWDALHAERSTDAAGNVSNGRVLARDTNGCLLRAEGVVLATIGVNNLNIIATPDAVLVTARGRSQDIRDIITDLAGDPVLARPIIRHHAWGDEHIIHDGDGLAVRRCRVEAGHVLSLSADQRVMLLSGAAALDHVAMTIGVQAGGETVHAASAATLLLFG